MCIWYLVTYDQGDKTGTVMVLGISAGGTGGHIVPALHVAKAWIEQGGQCVWFGRANSLEEEVARKNGIQFVAQKAVLMRGRHAAKGLPRMAGAIWAARKLLKKKHVQVVFSTGAYVSFPVAFAAKILGLPLIIHEQNTHMGRANRLLSKVADQVCLGLPIENMPKEWITGNPTALHCVEKEAKYILVIGGSQGCRFFNESLPKCFSKVGVKHPIIHLAGGNADEVRALYEKYEIEADVYGYHHEMQEVYSQSLFVIARSGAMTLAELSAYGLPSILVPYPHATNDHQRKNALYYVKRGAAIMVDEDERQILSAVSQLLMDPPMLEQMSICARSVNKPKATQRIIQRIKDQVYA